MLALLVGQKLIPQWLDIGRNRELRWPGAGRERRTCNSEVCLFVLDDRILDDLFELGSEITLRERSS